MVDFYPQKTLASTLCIYLPVKWNDGFVYQVSCHLTFFPVMWNYCHTSPHFLEVMEFRVLKKNNKPLAGVADTL